MSTQKKFIVFAILIATAAGLDAQGTATLVRPRQGVSFIEAWRPSNTQGDTRIIGQVIDIRQIPVANARVQLRNLLSGLVQQHDETDANGEYQFSVDDPGTYVVEMIMVDGYVIALSNAGALARFETLQTIVQLPGRWEGMGRGMVMPQNMTSFVGMSAATSMTAQTVAIALEQSIQPVDSGEPVSPFKP
jgi:hypothetical protein